MSKRQGGRIDEWIKQDIYSSLNPPGSYVLVGFLHGDSEWPDGTQVRTSPVVLQTETDVETKNTVYKLGEKLCQQDTTIYRRKSEGY